MSTTVLLKLPVTVVQWAHLAGLEPARNTMEMEGVLVKMLAYVQLLRARIRTLQMPQATVHSSLVAEAWFA